MSMQARPLNSEPQAALGGRAIVRTVKIVSGRRPRIEVYIPAAN